MGNELKQDRIEEKQEEKILSNITILSNTTVKYDKSMKYIKIAHVGFIQFNNGYNSLDLPSKDHDICIGYVYCN